MSEHAEEKTLTAKELEELRKTHAEFYKTEIKRLKLEEEYHKLIANIEEHKSRRMFSIIKMAQMTAGPEEEEEELLPNKTSEEGPSKENTRTLKKD
jgi:hypothetical protein